MFRSTPSVLYTELPLQWPRPKTPLDSRRYPWQSPSKATWITEEFLVSSGTLSSLLGSSEPGLCLVSLLLCVLSDLRYRRNPCLIAALVFDRSVLRRIFRSVRVSFPDLSYPVS